MADGLSWRADTVETAGETVYFEVSGPVSATDVVVLGHGGAGSHAVWYQQVPCLAREHRVVTWDTRGFGRSSLRTRHLSPEVAASDLAAVLDAVVTGEAVHLVGHSMGGWWITAYAFRQPSRVASLTFCNTPGGLFTSELEEHFAKARDAASRSEPLIGGHFTTGRHLREENVAQAFLYQQLNSLAPGPGAIVGEAVAHRFDLAAFRDLRIPTLFTASPEDPFFPPSLLQGVADAVGGRLLEMGHGHAPYFEAPDRFNDALIRHIERAKAGTSAV